MGVYVPGVAGVSVFYAAVFGVGVWAAATKRKKNRRGQDDMILANRGLGLVLGVFTLIGEPYPLIIFNIYHPFRYPPASFQKR